MKTIYIILINIFLCISAQSQTIVEAYTKALSLYELHDYSTAILEFKRIPYFDSNFKTDTIKTLLADSYFIQGDYEKALFYYSQVTNVNILKKVSCYILTSQYSLAQNELKSYVPELKEQKVDFFMLQTCLYLQLNQIDSAHFFANKLVEFKNDTIQKFLDSSFFLLEKYNSQSLVMYQIASAILPGIGLVVLGHTKQGLRSFTVVTSLIFAFICTSLSYSVFDACITVGPWLTRYYIGQIKNIKKQHNLKIDKLRYQVFLSLMNTYELN